MKYSKIIEELNKYDLVLECDNKDLVFDDVTYNSKEVKTNYLFICKGATFKKEYLEEAILSGATCYVSEIDYEVSISGIIVNDIRKSMAIIANMFYPDNMYKIGITGTKGKTTTNYFIHNILKEYLGYKPGIFATHYFYTGKNEGETHLTTPESLELHKYLNEMDNENLKYMSMEVSSQASLHNRVFGMSFNIGCFLNISPDHISPSEHKSFDEYFTCKLSFLKQCETVIVYRHTDYFEQVLEACQGKKVITFGMKDADYIISDIESDNGYKFVITNEGKSKTYRINMKGRFNVVNACCAIVISYLLNIDDNSIQKGLLETSISGRMNVIDGGVCPIIIDYAHNELSAKALYESLKEDYPEKNIKVIFGCPGDKGINRRKDMGLLAGKYADYVYLTAEDPAHYSVTDICNQIAHYIKESHSNYEIIEDRKEAIQKALKEATKDDVIAILGKGDETYQIIGDKWIPYETDSVIVKEELSKVKE